MTILITCPGRHGDILWTLPALRALHEATGADLDLAVAPKYQGVCELIGAQPYLRACYALLDWEVHETAPMTPIIPTGAGFEALDRRAYDRILHLGYRSWPNRPLPDQHLWDLQAQLTLDEAERVSDAYDLRRPWITVPLLPLQGDSRYRNRLAMCFTDEWIELKVGIVVALLSAMRNGQPWKPAVYFGTGSRWLEWEKILGQHLYGVPQTLHRYMPRSWLVTAQCIQESAVVLADNSASHVLACGLGTPVVLVEPAEARHHPIFYPYGQDGPEVTLVKGGDGLPTFDARHVAATLTDVLARTQEARHAR